MRVLQLIQQLSQLLLSVVDDLLQLSCLLLCQRRSRSTLHVNSGKLRIRPDHPRRRPIEIQFGPVGGLRAVVVSFEFHQNRPPGYRDVTGRNLPTPITLANSLYYLLYSAQVNES